MYSQNTYRKICEQCGCEFTSQKSTTHYCSSRCANLARKHRNRDERLRGTAIEVRARERLALLDKDSLTISDAARLLQMSRNTLYKIIKEHGIQLQRFTVRTVRIAREDLDRIAAEERQECVSTTPPVIGRKPSGADSLTYFRFHQKYCDAGIPFSCNVCLMEIPFSRLSA